MNFKEFPKERTILLIIIITFIPFIVITVLFSLNEIELVSTTGFGLLDLELAWTPARVNGIFAAWGPIQMPKQIMMMHLDFFYPLFYGLFGWGCLVFISRKLEGKLLKFGLNFCFATIIAGIFDELENFCLLLLLQRGVATEPFLPFFAMIFAALKIGLILLGLSLLYVLFIHWLKKKYNKSIQFLYFTLIGSGILVSSLLFFWKPFFPLSFALPYFICVFWTLKLTKEED